MAWILVLCALLVGSTVAGSGTAYAETTDAQLTHFNEHTNQAKLRAGITSTVVVVVRSDNLGVPAKVYAVPGPQGTGYVIHVDAQWLATANAIALQHTAEHEVCHVALKHPGAHTFDNAQGEREAELCVYRAVGEERYLEFAREVYKHPQYAGSKIPTDEQIKMYMRNLSALNPVQQ